MGTVCSLSSVCLRACPPCSLQLVPLLLPLSLSLVLLSRCFFGHMILSGSSLVLPCPPLFPPTCILNPLPIAAAGGRMDFLASCVSPCLFSFVQVTFPYPRSLSTTCYPTYLPTCLQLVSLSSLHYRASFQVSSIWDREDSFSPLSFLSFLVPVVFPSAFFTSLPHSCCSRFWDPRFSLSPMCSHLCPYSASFFLLAVWSRLWDLQVLWGHKHYRVPHLCPFRHRLVAVSSLHFFLSLPATVLLPGCFWHRILFMTLRGCSMAKDSSCLPFVSILVSLSVPNLFLYFSISIAILLSGCFWSKESPRLPFLSLHCSVFFVLVALGTGLKSHLFWYSSLYFTLTCGCSLWVLPGHSMLLVLLFSPTRALTSLSLLLFFSLGAYLDTWFSLVPHLSSLVLVCSLQHVSLIPSSLLLLLGKERISWPLVFLLNFPSFVQVTFPYPRSLPHVTLLTFLLVSNLSPYPLSTTVLLSRSPAFGTERVVFLLFPFFPSLSL